MTPTNKRLLVEIFLTRRLAKSLTFCKFLEPQFRALLLVIQKYFNPAVREICYFDILRLLSQQYKVGIFFFIL